MKKAYLTLLTSFIMTGCSEAQPVSNTESGRIKEPKKQEVVEYMISPAGTGPVAPSATAFEIYSSITNGMPEDDLTRILQDVTLESGTVQISDNTRRVYFKLGKNVQVWVELKGDMNSYVTRKGEFEAKKAWKRYPNDRIVIVENDTK